VATRFEIELTSQRDGGDVWTWRAAGAKQPKGELDGAILPAGAAVGDILRAEAEFLIDGIEVVAVLPPKAARQQPELIEMIGSRRDEPLVQTNLAGKSDRQRRRKGRDDRPDGERRSRSDGERRSRSDGKPRSRSDGEHRARSDDERRSRPPRELLPERPRPKRIRAGRTHRDALLASLDEAERPVAEQLLLGGLPAVRAAVAQENTKAITEGRPEMPAAQVEAIAERLLHRTRDADWRDRAEAALRIIDEVDLRDLRSVVVAGENSARDDESRQLLAQLRGGLDRRMVADERQWVSDIATEIGAGRFVRALRLSSRSPKAGMPVPPEIAERLVALVSTGLNDRTPQELWVAALDALASSPVRSRITVSSRPASPSDDLLEAVRRVADILPVIAEQFGVSPSEAVAARKRRPRGPRPDRAAGAPQRATPPAAPPIPPAPAIPPAPEIPTAPANPPPHAMPSASPVSDDSPGEDQPDGAESAPAANAEPVE